MKFLNEYFVFSSSERRGVFLFTLLLLLVILGYIFLPSFYTPKKSNFNKFEQYLSTLIDKRKDLQKLDSKQEKTLFRFNPNTVSKKNLIALGLTKKQASTVINYRNQVGQFTSKEDFKKVYGITNKQFNELLPYVFFNKVEPLEEIDKKELPKLHPSNFNPNYASQKELLDLGLSKKQVSQIINYRSKGGYFHQKEDFKKIYAITTEDYKALESYIQIDSKKESVDTLNKKKNIFININQASAKELTAIRGIGEKRSATIVKYRDLLGGFYHVNQLKEVYGMDAKVVDDNLAHLKVSEQPKLVMLNINTLTIKELSEHPYISYNKARIIVNYRKVHGLFTHVNEIKTNNLLEDKDYSKIAPYLSVK